MADASLRVSAPTLTVVDGIPTTTSVDVARHFGKRHDHVLRDIRALVENPLVPLPIFGEMSYEVEVANGAKVKQPAYRITRDGFTLLAMGFTGKRALQFKLAYIDAFNRMEAELRAQATAQISKEPAMAIPHKPSETQMREALNMALAVAGFVQQDVARAVLRGGDDWKHQRYLISFITDSKLAVPPIVERLKPDAMVLEGNDLFDLMADIITRSCDAVRAKRDAQKARS